MSLSFRTVLLGLLATLALVLWISTAFMPFSEVD